MNMKGFIAAIGAFIVTTANALIALFASTGVEQFSDVNQVAYASAVLGGAVASVMAYKARMAPSPPEKVKAL